jgi:uncharacterized protein YhfF
MDGDQIEAFWQSYLETLPPASPVRDEQYVAEGFGDYPQMADELGALVASGIKTATCSAFWEREAEGSRLPEVGQKSIVLDGSDNPLCIIETTEVEVQPYSGVNARFAYDEGEGERWLEYWREAHWRFFSRALPNIGKKFTLDMPLGYANGSV